MPLKRAKAVRWATVNGDDAMNLNRSEMMVLVVVKVQLDYPKFEDRTHMCAV